MIRIAICTPDLSPGDAVSNDVIGMYHALTDRRYEARIFAENTYINRPQVHRPEHIKDFLQNSEDILIYHHSVGWDIGINLLRELKCRKVIKYHNVTPPEFFEGINSDYVNVCRAGRHLLTELARIDADLYVACSEYSKHELIAAGANENKCGVVPPFHHIDRLYKIEADLNELDRYNDENITVLMVGRLAPNKGHNALIDAYIFYNQHYNSNSRLLIVGGEDPKLQLYTKTLQTKVKSSGFEDRIIFTGKVSDAALKAYYLVADVFMITSRHEGFCVPLIEAMSMKIPIVAYASSAIPDTVGKVGLVWEEYNPELMAASVDKIVRNERVRISLGEMGWRRYQNMFTNDRIKERFFEALKNSHLIN